MSAELKDAWKFQVGFMEVLTKSHVEQTRLLEQFVTGTKITRISNDVWLSAKEWDELKAKIPELVATFDNGVQTIEVRMGDLQVDFRRAD